MKFQLRLFITKIKKRKIIFLIIKLNPKTEIIAILLKISYGLAIN